MKRDEGGERCRYGEGGGCEGECVRARVSRRGDVARARVSAPNEVGGGG